jgi:hypothetical protein
VPTRLIIVFGVFGSAAVLACASPDAGRRNSKEIRLEVPVSRAPIQPDGALSPGEWEGSIQEQLERGHLRIRRSGAELSVAIEMDAPAIASVLVATSDRAWVLHASAALGTGEYRKTGDGQWKRVRDFDYACRDPVDAACRDSFLDREGWLANVDPHGTKVREFVLLPARFAGAAQELRIVVTALVLPQAAQTWPATDDAATSSRLQQGFLPETLELKPERWAVIRPDRS